MTSTFYFFLFIDKFLPNFLNKIKLFVAFIRNYTLKPSSDLDKQQKIIYSYYVHINESFLIKILIN